jgi:aryl-alcohol dehydrogenase-like predicted oxidoreductase
VEGELTPMAVELGLGVTPWSPLRGGVLSGKYTRDNAASAKPGRGERVTAFLTERVFTIIDEIARIAAKLGASPATVAIAWLLGKPGVSSVIIGARRVDQLADNLAAADLTLDPDDVTALDKVSAPTLGFPAAFLHTAGMFMHGGATVNGVPSSRWPLAPASDAERY